MSQRLRIVADKPKVDLNVLMGEGPAQPTGGVGGWVTVQRPDQLSFTEWQGNEPLRQDIPLMLDGFADGRSVEGQLASVERLGREVGYGDGVPPVFRVFGAIHYSGMRVVLESLDYGDKIRDRDGTLLRQSLVLHVIEFIDPDEIKFAKRKKKASKGDGGKSGGTEAPPSVYTTHKDDTLVKIAVKFYGDRAHWKKIRDLNPKAPRDPHAKMKAGIKLKLPRGW